MNGLSRGLLSLAVLIVGSATTPILASSESSGREPAAALAAADYDAANYADYFGVSIEEARERLGLQALAGQFQDQLSKLSPKTFAGLWITNAPEFGVTAAFTDSGPTDLPALAGTRLAKYLRTQRVASSLDDLLQLMTRYPPSPASMFDMGIDVANNRVVIYADDVNSLNARFADRLASDADQIVVRTVPALSKPAVNVYGGLPITLCTSGFGIIKAGTGERGIVTAGHCPDATEANGVNLPFRAQLTSGSYDLQWNARGTSTIKNWAQWLADGTTRTITSRVFKSNQVVGSAVCKYGNTTFYTCADIQDLFYAPNGCISGATPTYVYLHRAGVNMFDHGDSGGPVFLNSAAYGIGNCLLTYQTSPRRSDEIYTAEDNVEIGLNITVMTAP
jgi:hypothetical protein